MKSGISDGAPPAGEATAVALPQRNMLLLQCNMIDTSRDGRARRRSNAMQKPLAMLRTWLARPAVRYSLIAVASVLWLVGLADQVPDPMQTAKYVGISLLMAAVAAI
jgi:hypothetical protein